MYYLKLERKLHLETKSLEELKQLVFLGDKQLDYESKIIANELKMAPFMPKEFMEVARAVYFARYARKNIVIIPAERRKLAKNLLKKFLSPEDEEIRNSLKEAEINKDERQDQFISILFFNAHLLDECKIEMNGRL